MNDLETYIHLSKYSRWMEKEKRRETWEETVDRLMSFWDDRTAGNVEHGAIIAKMLHDVREGVIGKHVMPSMRTMMTAGKALERDHAAGYNCWAIAVNHVRVFDEIFYLLMCGGGVGFSVERQYVNMLPEVAEEFHDTTTTLKIQDSKIGWAKGLKELISLLYNGDVPLWDVSDVRPAGARLRTFGGRASGPEPLVALFNYVVNAFRKSAGRKLNSIECHDLVCKIADTVVVGSVRRSACISVSNLTDHRMRDAKTGEWYNTHEHRRLANNSVGYTEKPDLTSFLNEFHSLYTSKSGERGIINKVALKTKAEGTGREHKGDYLLNPCGEAILRDTGGCCNLTEVVIRPCDTLATLEQKVRNAAILGTLQSTLTNFRYLRKVWKKNAEEERLLGIGFTGIMDHPVMSGREPRMVVVPKGAMAHSAESVDFYSQFHCGIERIGDQAVTSFTMTLPEILEYLKEVARRTNEKWADILGIEASKQLTLIKPSGTVSLLCSVASGIHPKYAPFFLRRVTQDSKDPLTQLMIDQGIPYHVNGDKVHFSFPEKALGISGDDITSMQQLELWKIYNDHWCEGNPSQTIFYDDDSFTGIQDWLWKNWDTIGGLSFFPRSDDIYDPNTQPILRITEQQYEEAVNKFPTHVAWDRLIEYEKEDGTTSSQTLACAGNQCEITS